MYVYNIYIKSLHDGYPKKVSLLCTGICLNINLMITTGRWNLDIHLVVIYTNVFKAANKKSRRQAARIPEETTVFYSYAF